MTTNQSTDLRDKKSDSKSRSCDSKEETGREVYTDDVSLVLQCLIYARTLWNAVPLSLRSLRFIICYS